MTKKDDQQGEAPVQIVKWDLIDHPSIYANLMQLNLTPFDISILFGEVRNANPTQVFGVPKVKLTVSPEQAAQLMELLRLAVEQYVNQHGELRNTASLKAVASPEE